MTPTEMSGPPPGGFGETLVITTNAAFEGDAPIDSTVLGADTASLGSIPPPAPSSVGDLETLPPPPPPGINTIVAQFSEPPPTVNGTLESLCN